MPDFQQSSGISVDALTDAAAVDTGLSDFGPNDFREPLELRCAGLRGDAMSPGGRQMLADDAVRYLSNRLRVIDHHRSHPELEQTPVTAPIVILGLPRTGTTALSYLLDQDPKWRSLLNWEAVESVPPPTTDSLRSDPRCLARLEFQRTVLPLIEPPPPHWEWADGPTECTFLMAQDFKAAMWESRIPNPAYREYIGSCDMTSAYDYHRSVLQVLQTQAPGSWVLKMPAHAYFIDALLAAYPDARIVWTHRDPVSASASFMNLMAFSHRLSLGRVNTDWIVETYPQRLADQANRPMAALAGRDVHHFHYARYLRDPLGEMRQLYGWLDEPLTGEAEAAMTTWLSSDPLAVSRSSRYSLDDFGLSRAEMLSYFADYIAEFNVELDE